MVKLTPILNKLRTLRTNRKFLYLISGLGILLILFLGRSLVFAAFVNGLPVSRISVIKELEAQGGKSVLDNLIEKSLVFQEASKQGVKIGQEVVDAEIARIEDLLKGQGLTLDQALEARGETRESLIEQIRLQKTIEAILGAKVTITEEEMKKYFGDNKDLFAEGAKYEDVKEDIRAQLFQTKLSEQYAKWIEELRAKAKIIYFVKF